MELNSMGQLKPEIRNMAPEDINSIRELVKDYPPLTAHENYVYRILAEYFSETCFVVEFEGELVGFASGFISQKDPSVFFIWQVCIDDSHRKKLIMRLIREHIKKVAKTMGCKKMQFTAMVGTDIGSSMSKLAKLPLTPVSGPKEFLRSVNEKTGKEEIELLYEVKI
ncbi:GNAT family N-acetyltransferase [Candidatus Poribacteria bacterium]|nr:GNAT family N-acetyltransferase [Candidatus Poribacteria bacterium]